MNSGTERVAILSDDQLFLGARGERLRRSRTLVSTTGAVQMAPERDEAIVETSEVQRAIAAATSIVAALGLTVDDAIVLQNSNKLALRVLPCEVFARVAHVGHEVAQFEIDLAKRLAETDSSPTRTDRSSALRYET